MGLGPIFEEENIGVTPGSGAISNGTGVVNAEFAAEITAELAARIKLPTTFTGNNVIPDVIVENTLVYINSDGDAALYPLSIITSQFVQVDTQHNEVSIWQEEVLANTVLVSNNAIVASNQAALAEGFANQAQTTANQITQEFVSNTTTLNSYALNGNVTLDFSDVSAMPNTYVPDWSQLTNVPDLATQTEINLLASSEDLSNHTENTTNPHSVTKTQVGLGNVTNTSDVNKPISLATQTALNLKAAESHTHVEADITDLDKYTQTQVDTAVALKADVNALAAHTNNTSNPHNTTKSQLNLGNVNNTSDVDKPISTLVQSALDGKIDSSQFNVANGLAPLGANNKVPSENLPDSVLGALVYSGVWNAFTNTPNLTVIVAQGNYYKVSAAGTTNLSGVSNWNIGDWVVSNGITWDKIDNTDSVISVAGKTSVVTLVKADVGLSNVNNTSDTNKPISTLTQTALNNKVDDTQVLTNVPTGAIFTDTTYSVGDGGLSQISFTSADNTKLDNIAAGAEVNVVDSVAGKTGVVSLVKSDVGLSNVDNSSDANKPVSIAQQALIAAALVLKADTTTVNTNTSNIATNTAGIELAKTIMSKADFFALSEKRIRDNAGSGFAEWGKHDLLASREAVNEGMSLGHPWYNTIVLGNENVAYHSGTSRTGSPIISVNGVLNYVNGVGSTGTGRSPNSITFPPAPDGTKTYDSATGTVVTHATSAIAFAAETATNKVITTRQDFVFLESFHEKISDKDVVYPLGNVQYGASTWEGISLSTSLVAQGYSAFGEWDTTTTGRGITWSTLSAADKVKFLQDSENNIYNDDGELIQVRYRVRVVEGLGDEWGNVDPQSTYTGNAGSLNYAYYNHILPKGHLTTNIDIGGSRQYLGSGDSIASSSGLPFGSGAFQSRHANGHNGLCFALPIALVQRLNQGGYHPVYNPEGCSTFWKNDGGFDSGRRWYEALSKSPSSTSECFYFGNTQTSGDVAPFVATWAGVISGGSSGRPTSSPFLYYDAIYAGQVQDLRTSSNRQTTNELLNEYSRKGIAGTIRGKESVPFTKVYTQTLSTSSGTGDTSIALGIADTTGINIGDVVDWQNSSGDYQRGYVDSVAVTSNINVKLKYPNNTRHRILNTPVVVACTGFNLAQYETLPYQDIIGDPARIAATFPNGVYGQWIPKDTGGDDIYPLNRKVSVVGSRQFTSNNGVTWTNGANIGVFDATMNQNTAGYSTHVALHQYSTPANPYELANNAEVIGELGDAFVNGRFESYYGGSLTNGLLGKVCTYPLDIGNLRIPLMSYIITENNALLWNNGITHNTPSIPGNSIATVNSPMVKTFPYITQENSQYYLQWVYKEMIWDTTLDNGVEFIDATDTNTITWTAGAHYHITTGAFRGFWYCIANPGTTIANTNWSEVDGFLMRHTGVKYFKRWDGNGFGDDNNFNIVSGESTVLDDNGNSVLVGQKRVALPFFTGKA